MYQQTAGSIIGNTMQNIAIGAQQAQEPPSSILNSQLLHLHHLQENLRSAVGRASGLADALLGSQPSPLNKADGIGAKLPVEPPLTAKISDALHGLQSLSEELHAQLARLERL